MRSRYCVRAGPSKRLRSTSATGGHPPSIASFGDSLEQRLENGRRLTALVEWTELLAQDLVRPGAFLTEPQVPSVLPDARYARARLDQRHFQDKNRASIARNDPSSGLPAPTRPVLIARTPPLAGTHQSGASSIARIGSELGRCSSGVAQPCRHSQHRVIAGPWIDSRGVQKLRSTMPTTRRALLGSAAMAVGAGVGALMLSKQDSQAQHRSDGVSDEILAQMESHVRALAVRPSGEPLRGVANGLRVLAAHEVSSGMNASAREALNRLVRENGEAYVLGQMERHGPELVAKAKALGLDVQPPFFADYATGKVVLDRLRRDGFAGDWRKSADLFDSESRRLDAITPVALRQDPCYFIRQQLDYLAIAAALACISGCGPCCVAATLSWAAWVVVVQQAGC